MLSDTRDEVVLLLAGWQVALFFSFLAWRINQLARRTTVHILGRLSQAAAAPVAAAIKKNSSCPS